MYVTHKTIDNLAKDLRTQLKIDVEVRESESGRSLEFEGSVQITEYTAITKTDRISYRKLTEMNEKEVRERLIKRFAQLKSHIKYTPSKPEQFNDGDEILLINPAITERNGYNGNVGDVHVLRKSELGDYSSATGGSYSREFLYKNYVKYTKENWVKYFLKFMDEQESN